MSSIEQVIDRSRLYVLISGLESDLRRILSDWVLPYKEEADVFEDRHALLRERAEKDGADPDQPLLDYADFADSFQFINRHSQMVPAEIAEVVRRFTPELSRFVGPRNRVMHNRPLHPDDLAVGIRLCLDLLDTKVALPTVRDLVKRIGEDPNWSHAIPARTQSGGNAYNNLPLPETDETGLLGRGRESDELLKRLLSRKDPVITLVGEGGMGKTALALNTLWDLVFDPACPFDAVLWASLKTERLTAEGTQELDNAVRDVLGATEVLGQALDEGFKGGLDALGTAIEGLDTLLAVDNVESADSEEIVNFYDAMPDGTRILLTSRVGLGQIERRMPVGPLDEQSGGRLLRRLAERRGLKHLATLPQEQLTNQVRKLRSTPLAIRWYVEAVGAGADPRMAISDQAAVLRFCLETIYRDLSESARSCLSVLHASRAALDAPELAVVAVLPTDDLNRALQDLQRRSLVEVQLGGEDGLLQRYALTAATAHYLASVNRPSDRVLKDAEDRLKKLRQSEEHRALLSLKDVTRPDYLAVEGDEHGAVAHLLEKALLTNRKNTTLLPEELERAKGLAPDYFEVHRVEGFIATQRRELDTAQRAYERAYELAPDDEGRARVAFFYSWVVANHLRDPVKAEQLASEAHSELDSPSSACRLGQIKMYLQRFDEAETLFRSATNADDVRSALIARTQLTQLAKRRVEHAHRSHRAVAGVQTGVKALKEVNAYLNTGVTDEKLREQSISLAAEILIAAAKTPAAREIHDPVVEAAEFLRAHQAEVLFHASRGFITRAAVRIGRLPDVSRQLAAVLTSLQNEVGEQSRPSGASQGRVVRYNDESGYGFIERPDGDDNVFFHRTGLSDPSRKVLLVPGALVTCDIGSGDDSRPRASNVAVVEELEDELLSKRHGPVIDKKDRFLFARDRKTGVGIYVHQDAMRPEDWYQVHVGNLLRFDLEITNAAPAAIAGTVAIVED